jgi:putative transposase
MGVPGFIAIHRTEHAVPQRHFLPGFGVSESWFYKWQGRPPTPRQNRRADIDAKVKKIYDDSGGDYGSPRIYDEL